jgi:hypothetical protein
MPTCLDTFNRMFPKCLWFKNGIRALLGNLLISRLKFTTLENLFQNVLAKIIRICCKIRVVPNFH